MYSAKVRTQARATAVTEWMATITTQLLAQQPLGQRPEWLEGRVELPFEWVGAIVGLAILAGLLYLARRASEDAPSTLAEREAEARRRARREP